MTDNAYAAPNPESNPAPLKSGFKLTLIKVLAVAAIVCVVIALLMPATRRARPAARRTQCKNNLKQIGLALHNYHDVYGSFPPAFTVDSNGMPLHSWRTLILPFIDQRPLYDKIDLSKPWNDPANAEVYEQKIPGYLCPSTDRPAQETTYMVVVGPKSVFPSTESRSLKQITDGTANTIAVIEVPPDKAVHWMSPIDATEQQFLEVNPKTKVAHTGGMHVLMSDGSVRYLSWNLDAAVRHGLITIDGGETIRDF